MKPRQIALTILLAVFQKHSHLGDAIQAQDFSALSAQELSWIKAVCFGVCRRAPTLHAITMQLLQKPFKAKECDVLLIIYLGLYQLEYARTPDHAAVSQTVALAAARKKPWAKAVVNAVLRRFQRERETLLQNIAADPAAASAHPLWLLQRFQHDYPKAWQEIVAANNQQAPMHCRVNLSKISRQDYLAHCEQRDIAATADPIADSAITLTKPCAVDALPGFADGWISVQDLAAQLTPSLLALEPGLKILDACAAPGGKLCHLLETQAELAIIALDKNQNRCQRIQHNLSRLNLNAKVLCNDATDVETWWDGQAFDRIVLDAPCSATGVIRRHPDIKIHRRIEHIDTVVKQQQHLLATLWPLLKPGGLMLYITCSILPEENTQNVERFLQSHNDAITLPITHTNLPDNAITDTHQGLQLLPGTTDGFYYCLIKKN